MVPQRRSTILFLLLWYLEYTLATDLLRKETILRHVAFGSCHKNQYVVAEDDPSALWRTIYQSHQPQAFLWTGDTVYVPKRGVATIDELALEYDITVRLLKDVKAAPPLGIYGTWDDHDFGGNDMGKGMKEKEERRQLLLDFLNYNHWFPKQREGVYHSVDFGVPPHQVKVIFLDTRWHRDDYRCVPSVLATSVPLGAGLSCIARWLSAGLGLCSSQESATVLGKEQWRWFEREISTSQAQLHIVVSSIQVLTTNPVVESWGHFEYEQERLINLLQRTPRGRQELVPTVLMSGDVHHAEIIEPIQYDDESLFEVTSSGLTHSCTKPFYGGLCGPLLNTFSTHRSQKDAFFIGRNFGTLEIDWDLQQYRVLIWSLENKTSTPVLKTQWKSLKSISRQVEPKDLPKVVDGHLLPRVRKLLTTGLIIILVLTQLWIWFILVPRSVAQHTSTSREIMEYDDVDDDDANANDEDVVGEEGGGRGGAEDDGNSEIATLKTKLE